MSERSSLALRSAVVLAMLVLTGCHSFGSDTREKENDKISEAAKKVSGERYTILGTQAEITPEPSLADVKVDLPSPMQNLSWPQKGANPGNALGAVVFSGFEHTDHVQMGDGNEWKTQLLSTPIIADGIIYTMDAKGYITAYSQKDMDKTIWESEALVTKEKDDILGGGLAYAGSVLIASSGQGDLYALNIKDGKEVWHLSLGMPTRSAPKVVRGTAYLTTVDNQLFAVNVDRGVIVWQHRSAGENVGFLTAVSPAVGDNFLVVAYSSGEIFGLAADTGQEIWNDSLALTRRTSATSVFTGFDGDPVIAGGVVFASSNNGLTAATHLLTGRRLWETEISAADTPWLVNNFLFVLTTDAQLVALQAVDGKIKWTRQLQHYVDEKEQREPVSWHGPVLANDKLLLVNDQGQALLLDTQDGTTSETHDIPEGVRASPVIADGVLYVVNSKAKLTAIYGSSK